MIHKEEKNDLHNVIFKAFNPYWLIGENIHVDCKCDSNKQQCKQSKKSYQIKKKSFKI